MPISRRTGSTTPREVVEMMRAMKMGTSTPATATTARAITKVPRKAMIPMSMGLAPRSEIMLKSISRPARNSRKMRPISDRK
jgi:hypothetical protein